MIEKIKNIKLKKHDKFIISWVILTIILLLVCYPIGHLSVIIFTIYSFIGIIPRLKVIGKKYLDWMNHDD